MSRFIVKPNGYQQVEECYRCGNEFLQTFQTWGNAWQTSGCELCTRRDRIDLLKRQCYLDLRNMIYSDGDWVGKGSGDIATINRRLRRTMWFGAKALGYELATHVLMKCIKDYWNEVKGYWVHSHRCGVSYRPPHFQQSP